MNTAEQILVVILSSALAVFIVLAIIATVNLIRLLKTLQLIADKAEGFVESAEAAAQMVKGAVGQLSLVRFLHSVVDFVRHKQDGGDNNNKDKGEDEQ